MYLGGNHWWVTRRSLPPAWSSVPFSFVLSCVWFLVSFPLHVTVVFYVFCRVFFIEMQRNVPFSSRQGSLSTPAVLLFFAYLSCDTSCDSVRPMKTFLDWWTRAEVLSFSRFCSISWGIFCLLVAFISLAIMGWLNLFTKRLVM